MFTLALSTAIILRALRTRIINFRSVWFYDDCDCSIDHPWRAASKSNRHSVLHSVTQQLSANPNVIIPDIAVRKRSCQLKEIDMPDVHAIDKHVLD